MYPVRPPALLRPLLPGATWAMPADGREVYLTFDDGPEPQVTPWVLDRLARAGARASFFCIGRNAARHPAIMQRTRAEGHAIGNHTWDHANGWRTGHIAYLRQVLRCQPLTGTTLFRPPYGRITPGQARALSRRFRLVMWDVLSGDFDTAIGPHRCARNVLDHVRPGSIVVFHDSRKAWPRLRQALPVVLDRLKADGWSMRALPAPGGELTPGSR